MSASSHEQLRRGALAMLADGNGVASVAHLLGVPVDVVAGWQSGATGPVPSVSEGEFAETAPEPPPARLHFDEPLVYAASDAFRLVNTFLGFGLFAFMLWCAHAVWQIRTDRVGNMATALLIVLMAMWGASELLRLAGRLLVLGEDDVVIPAPGRSLRRPYSDVAGYTLVPHVHRIGGRSAYKGQLLSIASRRAGVPPIEVFVFDDYPISRRMLQRLDEVVQANRHAAPLAAGADTTAGGVGGWPMAGLVALALLGAVRLWPIFSDSLGALWRGPPTLAMLRHVEGPVTSASACWTQSRHAGGQRVVSLHVADPTGSVPLVVPCLFDPDTALGPGTHRLAVDVDPGGVPAGTVYQMALDGRSLIA